MDGLGARATDVWLVKLSPQCLLRGVERVERRGKTSGVGTEKAARVADGIKGVEWREASGVWN